MLWLKILDIFFFVFHSGIVIFNTIGWAFPRLRRYNLLLLLATAGSWFILGIWYGWGYCMCTDWHWSIRARLGYMDKTSSYIDLLLTKLTGFDYPNELVDNVTLWVFVISLALSLSLNIRDYRGKNLIK